MSLETLESRIIYESISSGVNLEYILTGATLKENIILSSADANKPFVYDCLVTGLVPELLDNEIYFKNTSGETILRMQAPYMYDSAGAYSDAVTLSLEASGSGWKITIQADDLWLLDEERVYPVVIDPVISSSVDQADIKDASVWSNYPDTNLRDYSVLSTGYGTNTGDNRSFLKFELPSLNSADVVVNAQLVLTSFTSNGKECQVNLHEVFDEWDSGTITWNNKPDYNEAVVDYEVYTDAVGTAVEFDITDLVKGWYCGETNNGVMIKDSMEEGNYREYLSSDCSATYASYRPRIYVSYVSANGLESYWTYHSQSVGRAGTVSVNDYTGNLVLVHDTASTNGLNMPVSLSHVYNTNDKDTNLGYGYGFRLNYLQTVTVDDDLSDYKIYTDGDGTKHYFYYNETDGKWVEDAGLGLTLTVNSSSTTDMYVIEDKSDQKLVFDSSGRLVNVKDANGNTLSITYSGSKISKITDGAGKVVTLTYDSNGNLSDVISPEGIKYFTYSGNTLTEITDIDGSSMSYTYNSARLLTKVTNIDGYSMNYGYSTYSPNKVVSVEEMGGTTSGQSLSIMYAGSWTNFTDGDDYTETYVFNAAGNTKDSSGAYVYADSDELIPYDDGWYRLEVTAAIPSDSASTDVHVFVGLKSSGTTYFDCLQMESGNTASRYNLIENNDMRDGQTGFTLSGTTVFDHVANTDTIWESEPTGTVSSGLVTTNGLNVRTGPGTSYGILASASLNQRVYILGSAADSSGTVWYNIAWTSGQRVYYGYASSAYINKDNDNVTTQKALINTTTLNVRAGAGTGYSVIATATKDMEVQILESITSTAGQTWYMIHLVKNSERYTGCVLADYVLVQDMLYEMATDPPAEHGGELDNNVMMLYGNPGGVKRASQTIAISGSAGDAFMANAWGIGYSVPIKDSRSFGIEVEFTYTDGTTEAFVSNFNDHSVNWLFLSDVFIAKKDYTSVKASYIYGYNENVVYFDGLSLYKEEYGVSYVYDGEGNVISTTDAANKSNSFEYDANNNMTKLVDAKGSSFTYTYDDSHNVTSALSAAGVKYGFTYNTLGLPTESKIEDTADSSNYIKSSAAYASDGSAMTSVTDPLGHTQSYDYDSTTGRLRGTTDAKGNETTYTYDTLGRTIEVTSEGFTTAEGHSLTPYVGYSYNNDQLAVVGWHGNTYRFAYDAFGNKQSVALDSDTLITYTYEAGNGNVSTVTYGNGASFAYTYDKFDRITNVSYKASADGTFTDIYSYVYRKDGSLAQMCDIAQNKTYKYYYDLSQRLSKVVISDGTYYVYTYDANNNLVKVEEGNGTETNITEYTYDADNRETATKTNGKTYATTYDALGRITKYSWDTTEAYDTVLTYDAGADGSQSTQLRSIDNDGDCISYTYDANGNITGISDSSGTTTYYYDEMNQLYREDNHLTDQTVVYTYDAAGNILNKKIYEKTDAENLSAAPTDMVVYGYTSDWADQLTSYDGQAIVYDSIGNPTTYLGKTFTWIKGRQLSGISDSEIDYSYVYDADGIRTGKTNNNTNEVTQYQLDGDIIAAQTTKNASGTVTEKMAFTYDSAGAVIAMTYNGTQYFYKKNGQGDIIGLIDGSGNVVVNYSYDSWGKLLNVTGNIELGNANPFRYRGYYYDQESGFYYLNSRYYDSEVGRFLNADGYVSTGQGVMGHNMYSYCGNNPVNRMDYSGLLWKSLKKFAGKAIEKIRTTAKKIKSDVKNFNLKNTSEKKVLESNYFSAYKDKLVLRTNGNRSGSFGIIFITRETNTRINENIEDIVRHEYGHTEQLRQLGVVNYALCIGLPSYFQWGNEPSYYDRPWEITADIYGGVISRNHTDEKIEAGFNYLEESNKYSIWSWRKIKWD